MIIADLHIHGRFSRATSKQLTIENLEKWANIKGVNLLGTGDFTHPEWIKELKSNLDGEGILRTKNGFPFILQTEISLMYSQGGKSRKVHNLVLAPSFDVVDQITEELKKRGRVDYDGRPIFGMSCIEFVDIMTEISKDIEIIPAHIWTPWFGIFGSNSGFDSLKEAFQNKVDKIHAIETGMSSDPEMNWRIKELDNISIISFSDLHSFWPWRIGREATIFEDIYTYKNIISALRENRVKATIEVDPAYGKYHWDGHRLCNFSSPPQKTRGLDRICPICKNPLTIGVENRVDELAEKNRPLGFKHKNSRPFYKVLPLHELIALAKTSSLSSKKTWSIYNFLIEKFGNEFNILLNVEKDELMKTLPQDEKLIELILKNREGRLEVEPGFDGKYGTLKLDSQKSLSKFL